MAKQKSTNSHPKASAIQIAPVSSLAIPLQMLVAEFRSELNSLREQVRTGLAHRTSSNPTGAQSSQRVTSKASQQVNARRLREWVD